MKTNHRYRFVAGFVLGIFVLAALAWTPTERSFNNNQFGTNSFQIVIKSTAPFTNARLWATTKLSPDGVADWSISRVGDNISIGDSLSLFSFLFKNDGVFVASQETFAAGITNLATTDAMLWADANGRIREATMGSGVAFDIVTGTLSVTGVVGFTQRNLHGTNIIADFQYARETDFFITITNHTWITVSNTMTGGMRNKGTFIFYTPGLTAFQIFYPTNNGTLKFGSTITEWTSPSTNYSYGRAIGASNDHAHAIGGLIRGEVGGLTGF